NYEAGCNPLNMGFLTGVGWKRQRETVNQYANNDRRVLPPSGIPIGSIWPGAPNIYQYGSELNSLVFPTDSTSANNMFAPYEKWSDTFHVATEMVNPQQGRGLGATAWLMAQTAYRHQPWKAASANLVGLPTSVAVNQPVTIGMTAAGVDLSQASIVWEARDQEPTPGPTFTFAPKNSGTQWVEAEALLPDGRRVFAKGSFTAVANTTPTARDTAPATPTAKATFVKNDTSTAGNWKGNYGGEGSIVMGNSLNTPGYAKVVALGKSNWTWKASTSESKALLKAGNTSDRVAAIWYSPSTFNVDVNITDGKTHRISAYFVDFDNRGRAQTVEVRDRVTGILLDTRTITAFGNGRYVSWDVSGNVRLKITRNAGPNAVLSGLFFDAK
ncbi:MAG: hypothetical protein ACK4UN_17865, partial [Limisphaerales bacterium]